MLPESHRRALDRAEARLLAGSDVEAFLARREAGRPAPGDDERATELAAGIRETQQPDGSWQDSVIATAEALLCLRELEPDATAAEPAVARAIDWLRTRRNAPGRFGDGCSPDRHRLGLCHHFLGGFFGPGPGDAPTQEAVLASGARLPGGPARALGASCLALRALIAWGVVGNDVVLHLEGLRRLAPLIRRESREPAPVDVLPLVVHALLDAPVADGNRDAALEALTRLAQMQRADGSWPELDTFYVLEVLLAAQARHPNPTFDAALRRCAGLLTVTQQEHGAWDRDGGTRRLRIGWRTLRYATGAGQELRSEEV
jgi:hypothetical protein